MTTSINPIKMIPAQKRTWTSALRSGKYKQAKGALRVKIGEDSFGHCCLGVAECAINGVEPKIGNKLLPFGKYGLTGELQEALARVNDGETRSKTLILKSFAESGFKTAPVTNTRGRSTFGNIADWIDKNL